jgi:AraC family transcriptional regulator of arabinose operon
MDPRITLMLARMQEHLADPINVDALAAAVNLSGSRLAHLFSQEVGMPPARYLHELRMQRARALLERTVLPVKQVMTSVGINDPSHFARDFRRYHGLSPSQVRNRASAADRPTRCWPALVTDSAGGQER